MFIYYFSSVSWCRYRPRKIRDSGFSDGGSSNEKSPFSQDEEPKEWITTKTKAHIPIYKNESKKEAINEFIEEKENNTPKDITELMGEEIKGVKGQEAINTLLEKKSGHVKRAFERKDTGAIDLIWGDETCGLKHIIQQREKQGINSKNFLSDLGEVINNGKLSKNDRGRFEILYNGRIAIISPELRGNKVTFLLTAYKTRKK